MKKLILATISTILCTSLAHADVFYVSVVDPVTSPMKILASCYVKGNLTGIEEESGVGSLKLQLPLYSIDAHQNDDDGFLTVNQKNVGQLFSLQLSKGSSAGNGVYEMTIGNLMSSINLTMIRQSGADEKETIAKFKLCGAK
jgi:hypothetical protein